MATLRRPLFPLNTVLFPGGPLLLRIFEPRYLRMVSQCLREGYGFGVVSIEQGSEVGEAEFVTTGTLAEIVDWHRGRDGLLGLTAEGAERFRVIAYEQEADGLYVGAIEMLEPAGHTPLGEEFAGLARLLEELLERTGTSCERVRERFDDASWVGYRLAELLPLPVTMKQSLLELEDAHERLEILEPHLAELTVSEHA